MERQSLQELIDKAPEEEKELETPEQPEVEVEEQEVPEQTEEEAEEPEAREKTAELPLEDEGGEDAEEQGSSPTASLRAWLASIASEEEINDIPDEQLEEIARARMFGAPKPEVPPAAPKEEKQEPPKQETKEEAQERKRRLERLAYDPHLEEMVQEVDGKITGKPEFGDQGIEAAKKINAYYAEFRRRQRELATDPVGYLQEDLEDIVQQQVEKRLSEYQQSQLEAEKVRQAKLDAVEEEQVVNQIVNEYEDRFYKHDAHGNRRTLLKSGRPVMTEFGQAVDKAYLDLHEVNPGAPDSVKLRKAIEIVERYWRDEEASSPVARTSPGKEKRKQFVKPEKHEQPVADRKPPSIHDQVASGAKMSLWEAILSDPDNEGNPELSKLRR